MIGKWHLTVNMRLDDPGALELYQMVGEKPPCHEAEVEATFDDLRALGLFLTRYGESIMEMARHLKHGS